MKTKVSKSSTKNSHPPHDRSHTGQPFIMTTTLETTKVRRDTHPDTNKMNYNGDDNELRFTLGHNITRGLPSVEAKGRTRTSKISHSFLLLFLLLWTITSSSAAFSGKSSANSLSDPVKKQRPWEIYSEKLRLFVPRNLSKIDKNGARTRPETTTIVVHTTNPTNTDETMEHGNGNFRRGINSTQANALEKSEAKGLDLNSLLQFHCQGNDCPQAAPLQQASFSSEEFRPKFLPKWKELPPRRVIRSSNENREETLGINSVQGKIGPIRIFKYVHSPEELLKTSETKISENSGHEPSYEMTGPENSEYSGHQTTNATQQHTDKSEESTHRIANGKGEHSKNSTSFDRETNGTERSLIPNSYFKKESVKETKLKPNETTIITNGTDDRFRRSPFRPHWRDHKLFKHAREPLYETYAPPPHFHPPPPGYTAVAKPTLPNSFTMHTNELGMQQNPFGTFQQQNSFGNSPQQNSFSNSLQQNSFGNFPQQNSYSNSPQQNSYGSSSQQNSFVSQQNSFQQSSFGTSQNPSPQPNSFGIQPAQQPSISLLTIPAVAVPVALPLTNNGIQNMNQMASDRSYSPSQNRPDTQSPQEKTFHLPNFNHPFSKRPHQRPKPPGPGRRRPPQQQGRHRRPGSGPVPSVLPPPKPVPRPSRPHQQHQLQYASSGRAPGRLPRPNPTHPPPPPYATQYYTTTYSPVPVSAPSRPPPPPPPTVPYNYPKTATNIQDILTYFKEEENEIPETMPNPPDGSSSMPPPLNSGIQGFSNEFRDVEKSLLKDIKYFAKRPEMLRQSDERDSSQSQSPSQVPVPKPSSLPFIDSQSDDPLDEIFSPRPKPVREMIKYRDAQSSTERSINSYQTSSNAYKSNGKSASNVKSTDRGRYEDDRRNSYNYEDDEDDRKSSVNRHTNFHASQDEPKNSPRRPDDEYSNSKEDIEDRYPSRYRDGYGHKTSQRSQDHDRYKKPHHQDFKNDDGYSEERPYPNNLHPPPSHPYRPQQPDHDYTNQYNKPQQSYTPKVNKQKGKAQRPHRRRNRHKSKHYPGRHSGQRFRNRYREQGGGSSSYELMQSPSTKAKASTMEQAYYKQRNRPVVIKRPYQPYRPVDAEKVEEKRKQQDKHWNSVDTLSKPKAAQSTKNSQSFRPATIQKHYHYYGVTNPLPAHVPAHVAAHAPSPPPTPSNPSSSLLDHAGSTRRPEKITSTSTSREEDVLEIHTGSGLKDVTTLSTAPTYPTRGQSGYPIRSQGSYPGREESSYPKRGQSSYPARDQGSYPIREEQSYPIRDQGNYPIGGQSSYSIKDQSSYPIREQGSYSSYPSRGQPKFSSDYERGTKLHKAYLDYLQKKLEAQAEEQTESLLKTSPPSTTARPKRPMRMSIHIYPNEKIQVVDQNNNQNVYPFNAHHNTHPITHPSTNLITYNPHSNLHHASGHLNTHHHPNTHSLFGSAPSHVYNPGASGSVIHSHRSYGHYQVPTQTVAPSVIQTLPQPIIPSHGQPIRGGPVTTAHGRPLQPSLEKNKNLVLHLHVHRRNDDQVDDGHLDMAGSETVTSTVKPLTYEDIYQAASSDNAAVAENPPKSGEDKVGQGSDTQAKPEEDTGIDSDKSLSVELPIHEDKIDEVLNTLLKLRDTEEDR